MGNNKKKIQRVIVSGFLYSAGLVFKSNEGTETHFLLASLLRTLFFLFFFKVIKQKVCFVPADVGHSFGFSSYDFFFLQLFLFALWQLLRRILKVIHSLLFFFTNLHQTPNTHPDKKKPLSFKQSLGEADIFIKTLWENFNQN